MKLGKYTLQSRLGEGAFGAVYMGEYEGASGFKRRVAIKLLREVIADHPELLERFKVEAHIGSMLQHENIVQVIDFEEIEGQLLLVMEYVRGPVLRTLLSTLHRRHRVLPLSVTFDIIIQITRGLLYAHRAVNPGGDALNLIHRDLKPPNIILSTTGVAKIMDFGIARVDFALTQTGRTELKGTFAYMSPEQLDHTHRLTQATDQFSLGLILCEMILGKPVYHGELGVLLTRVKTRDLGDTFERILERCPSVEPVLQRMLAITPEERYPSMGEALRALTRAAPPPGDTTLQDVLDAWLKRPDSILDVSEDADSVSILLGAENLTSMTESSGSSSDSSKFLIVEEQLTSGPTPAGLRAVQAGQAQGLQEVGDLAPTQPTTSSDLSDPTMRSLTPVPTRLSDSSDASLEPTQRGARVKPGDIVAPLVTEVSNTDLDDDHQGVDSLSIADISLVTHNELDASPKVEVAPPPEEEPPLVVASQPGKDVPPSHTAPESRHRLALISGLILASAVGLYQLMGSHTPTPTGPNNPSVPGTTVASNGKSNKDTLSGGPPSPTPVPPSPTPAPPSPTHAPPSPTPVPPPTPRPPSPRPPPPPLVQKSKVVFRTHPVESLKAIDGRADLVGRISSDVGIQLSVGEHQATIVCLDTPTPLEVKFKVEQSMEHTFKYSCVSNKLDGELKHIEADGSTTRVLP